MNPYDVVADTYDEHFGRPVDRWEDARLRWLLAPFIDRSYPPPWVLDLGCGTGWMLDQFPNLHHGGYLGLDASTGMLERLRQKHPGANTYKVAINEAGWTDAVPWTFCPDVVTATWAAHDLGHLPSLLLGLCSIAPGALVLLHGQAPRYASRDHYVLDGMDTERGYLGWTPKACREAADLTGCRYLGAHGTGAAPDGLQNRLLWRASLVLPARFHYAFLAAWRLP